MARMIRESDMSIAELIALHEYLTVVSDADNYLGATKHGTLFRKAYH